jgi:hypothetical protein
MKTATRISEMQKFHFGRKIECTDGEAGSLTYIVFDDTTRRPTYLGLKQGHLFSKTYNLPYDTVVEATGEDILLHIPRAELAAAREETVQGAKLDRRSVVERTGTQDRGTLRLVAVHPKDWGVGLCCRSPSTSTTGSRSRSIRSYSSAY